RVGERGANLSAGQRQRVALARAFCRPGTSVLLLDEPTARLDGRSEAAVVSATAALSEGRTAVVVAHRPAMIDLADRVIRLHGGRVVADTTRDAPRTAERETTPSDGTPLPEGVAPPQGNEREGDTPAPSIPQAD